MSQEVRTGQGGRTTPSTDRSYHGRTDISKRYDRSYALWFCMSEGDLDMVATKEVKRAIEYNEPHRNPLKWAIVGTFSHREDAVEAAQSIHRTGLRQWLERVRAHSPSSLTALRSLTGVFGSHETLPAAMVSGLSSETTAP